MPTAEAYYFPKADFDSSKTNPLLAYTSQANLQLNMSGTSFSTDNLEEWYAGAGSFKLR